MLGWADFTGKLVGFSFSELVGKNPTLLSNQCMKIFWAILDLHDALADLESASRETLEITRKVIYGDKKRIYRSDTTFMYNATEASTHLIEELQKFCEVMGIFDKNMNRMGKILRKIKSILILKSRIYTEPYPESVFLIQLYVSSKKMTEIRDTEIYKYIGSKNALLSLLEEDLYIDSIPDNSLDKISFLYETVLSHMQILSHVREQASLLLCENFSIDDIL